MHQRSTLTPALFHILFSQHLFPPVGPHSTVKAGGTWETHGIPHRTCRLPHSSGSFTVVLCGVDYKWHGEAEEGDRLPAAEQVGMQLLPGWYANEWVEGWGWAGAVFGGTFTPREAVTKVAKWCHSHRHTQASPLYPFHQQSDKTGGEGSNAEG